MKPPIMRDNSTHRGRRAGQNSALPSSNVLTIQNERRSYKNISIYITELPPTPTKFRDKYHRAREPIEKPPVVIKPSEGLTDRPWITSYVAAQTPSIRRRERASPVVDRRPQTYQLHAISTVHVDPRPHTLGFETKITSPKPPSAIPPNVHALNLVRDRFNSRLSPRDRTEILDDMIAIFSDRDFMDELQAIERWFKVISHGEQTASLYALLQQTTPMQIDFFLDKVPSMVHND
jgi:hypothetical protein